MNDKLHKKFVFSELAGASTRTPSGSLMGITCEKIKDKDDQRLRFSVHPRILKEAGWKKNDVIDLHVDTNDSGEMIGFLLPAEKGRQLTQPKEGRGTVVYTLPPDTLEEFRGDATDVEVEEGRIAFNFPVKEIAIS
jgi:hypothetical protein